MHYFKRTLLALFAGLATTTAPILLAADQAPDVEAIAAQKLYNVALIESLLAEGTPRALVLAATTLPNAGENVQTDVERRGELLHRAAQMAPDDAWVQWFVALHAEPSETLSEPAQALLRLEADNGAVWLLQLQAATRANDSAGVTEALARIGASRYFDDHYVGFALEWLRFFKSHPTLIAPSYDSTFVAEAQPLVMAIARAAALAIPNYAGPMQACKPKGKPLAAKRRQTCLAAGRIMMDESATLISMQLGAAMLGWAGAPDAAEIKRNSDYLLEEYAVISMKAFENPADFRRYEADWLQVRNEIHVARNALQQAGLPLLPPPDWKSDRNRFMVDRANTDDG